MSVNEPHISCEVCGKEIYKETDLYEQDECYELDGYRMCAECVMPYLKKHHAVKLTA